MDERPVEVEGFDSATSTDPSIAMLNIVMEMDFFRFFAHWFWEDAIFLLSVHNYDYKIMIIILATFRPLLQVLTAVCGWKLSP